MEEHSQGAASRQGAAAGSATSPRTVGRYEILGQLGRGGMATVYLARQLDLDRLVALKELSAFHVGTAEFAGRFLRESRLAGSLSHPNIVIVHEYLEESGIPYIAMEYVTRGSLRPLVGRLSLPQLAGVLEGILAGLAHAELSGIVHRDLKPENIMVAADGRVKIADFGIAKATQSAGTSFMTETGMTLGTPLYMAPEQVMAEKIGPWTDLYAVGVIAHEQITGRAPFQDADAAAAIMMRHVNERIPSVAELMPQVDQALSDWIDRLLVKDPDARARSAARAWEELEEMVVRLLGPLWRRDARLPDGQTVASVGELPTLGSFSPRPAQKRPPSPVAPRADRSRRQPARRRQRAARSRTRLLRVSAPSAILLATVGFVVAPTTGAGNAHNLDRLMGTATAGSISVSLPSGWRQQRSVPAVPGLVLRGPLAVEAAPPAGRLVVGFADAGGPALLPVSLLGSLHRPPRAEAVRLGRVELLRYRGLRPDGAAISENAYSLPTTAGLVLGVCMLPSTHTEAAEAACERILGSLRVISGRALPLGPNPTYAGALSRAISTLNRSSASGESGLQHAQTAAAQAAAAERLADVYRQAVAAVRSAAPGPAEQATNAALAASLGEVGDGYAAMADAAREGNRPDFDGGRAAVKKGMTALAKAFSQLQKSGYRVVTG
jgi:serine/threonine protein kinase